MINPLTGRKIKKSGPTYAKLLSVYGASIFSSSHTDSSARKIHHTQKSIPVSADRFKIMEHMEFEQPDIQRSINRKGNTPGLMKRASTYKMSSSSGKSTRGWALDVPKRGKERHLLKSKCGEKCFLLPNSEGFPICKKCENTGIEEECTCKLDCRGVNTADIRAHQHKYTELYPAIEKLKSKCKTMYL